MRKIMTMAVGVLAVGVAWSGAEAATMTYKATLNGASEVPATSSKGTGTATITADTSTKMVTWTVDYSGLTGPATAAHIHCPAAPGANAGVAVPLAGGTASPMKGSAAISDAYMADLESGKCYVNIHTAENKGGEIRGQLMK